MSRPPLWSRLRAWLDERRRRQRARIEQRHRDDVAMGRALEAFRLTRHRDSMGAFVLRGDASEVIVRVMYMTDHIPPDRAWYAVRTVGGAVRELCYEDVATIETPWR